MIQIAVQMLRWKKEDTQYWNINTDNAELMEASMNLFINEMVFNILSIKENPKLDPRLCIKLFVTKRSLEDE